jgi:hypothetical protein
MSLLDIWKILIKGNFAVLNLHEAYDEHDDAAENEKPYPPEPLAVTHARLPLRFRGLRILRVHDFGLVFHRAMSVM